MLPWRTKTQTKDFQEIKVFSSFQQEQLLGSLDNFQPELPDTEDDEVKFLKHSVYVCLPGEFIIQNFERFVVFFKCRIDASLCSIIFLP